MNRRLLLVHLGLTLFLLSCGDKQKDLVVYDKFPISINLSEGTEVETHIPFRSIRIEIIDSFLIVTQTYKKEQIHIYNKKTFKHIASSGKRGRGPGEIGNPGFPTLDYKKKVIWYPDIAARAIWKFHIDSIVNNPSYKPKKIYKIPSIQWPPKKFFPYKNDDYMTYHSDNPKYYFYVADQRGKLIESLHIKDNTKIYSDLNRRDIKSHIWYYSAVHPSEDKIAIAYTKADIIVGLDYSGNIIFKIQGPDQFKEPPPKDAIKIAQNREKSAYREIKADSNYIYGLYHGDLHIAKVNNKLGYQYSKYIQIFNWKGNPLAELKLQHPTSSFAIDKDNDRIITYAADIGKFVYYNFDLKTLN